MTKPLALAPMVTVAVPSVSVLLGAVAVKFAMVEPALIVTLAGTVRRAVLFEESDTTSADGRAPEIDTVPVPVVPSTTEAGGDTVRFSVSLSITLRVALPSVQLATCATIVTGR